MRAKPAAFRPSHFARSLLLCGVVGSSACTAPASAPQPPPSPTASTTAPATPARTPPESTVTASVPANHLDALTTPRHSSPQDNQRFSAAMAWFKAHPVVAVDTLEKRFDTEPTRQLRIVEVFAQLRHTRTLPVLTRALKAGSAKVAWAAAQGLAQHPDPVAAMVLVGATKATEPVDRWQTAMYWLGERANKGDCTAVQPFLTDQDANRRYYALRAAHRMGCIDRAVLEHARAKDPDADVRKLAAELLGR